MPHLFHVPLLCFVGFRKEFVDIVGSQSRERDKVLVVDGGE